MAEKKIPETVDLVFKESPAASETETKASESHGEVGPSSLYGRVGDNMSFHAQGVYSHGFFDRLWGWAWQDLGGAFVGLLRLLSFRKEK